MSSRRTAAVLAAVSTAAFGGRLFVHVRRRRARSNAAAADRWQVITINRPVDAVAPEGVVRGPVADLGDRVETVVSAATGRGGTEVRARSRPDLAGSPDRSQVRQALRRMKQLVETGEILAVGPQPAGERPRTPAGGLIDAVVRRAPKEGVL